MGAERLYAIQGRTDSEAGRVHHAVTHMGANKAYRYAVERAGGDPGGALLAEFVERFEAYRVGWRGYPQQAFADQLHDRYVRVTGHPPLCVDIEIAAVCDLACPFCYRQSIVTPDKTMREELFYRLIDQCTELRVPSVKLLWRGEPLLHPMLARFVDYAKRGGILETIITTDAVTLTAEKSRALIEAGLDLLVYSFDGGAKDTYERMRPGRFVENSFEQVYENIRRFAQIRDEMGSQWPRTKIQMILTEQTRREQESFFELFSGCVDDVSVKAYTERGGALNALDPKTKSLVLQRLSAKGLSPDENALWRDIDDNVYAAVRRLPCEQPYQRLMVAYDGTVCMCCYDWGNEHPIGYVDARAYEEAPADYQAVVDKVEDGAKGYTLLANAQMPSRHVDPPKRVQTLKEIWDGRIVNDVRRAHVQERLEDIPICRECPFKETYEWEPLTDEC